MFPLDKYPTCLSAVSVAILAMLDRCCDHEAERKASSGQGHFVGPSAVMRRSVDKEECSGSGRE